jgi:hypothetical protein
MTSRLKEILTVILIIIAMITLDSLFTWLSIPVVSMDLMLIALSLVIITIGFKARIKLNELLRMRATLSLSFKQKAGYSLFLGLLIWLGLYLAIEGLTHPFQLFSGVRGASHGYTVSLLGVLITIYSALGLLILFPGSKNDS